MSPSHVVRTLLIITLVGGALLLAAGKPDAPAEGGEEPAAAAQPAAARAADDATGALPVAKIDDLTIDIKYVEEAAAKQSPLLRKELADPTKRTEFVEKLVNMELLAAEAERRGFGDHHEVNTVRKNQLASLMHRRLAEGINEQEPSEAELLAYYQEHRDSYHKPEKVRARHILISKQDKAEQLMAEVNKRKPSQHEFRRLAQENSEDESTRLRGGDLTFFTRPGERGEEDPDVSPEVAEAAFSLKENGEIHPGLVKSAKGFHVVMRTGHREKMDLSFEEARDRLKILVRREKRKQSVEDAIDALRERFAVTINEENLKDVVIDLSGGPPEPEARGGLTKRERKDRKKHLRSGRDDPQGKATEDKAQP